MSTHKRYRHPIHYRGLERQPPTISWNIDGLKFRFRFKKYDGPYHIHIQANFGYSKTKFKELGLIEVFEDAQDCRPILDWLLENNIGKQGFREFVKSCRESIDANPAEPPKLPLRPYQGPSLDDVLETVFQMT